MRLASGLLVAVLITTSTISGTYAKYVTEDSATDSARVAKFGVVVTAEGSLFAETYIDEPDETDGITVQSVGALNDPTNATVDNVVAPGTKNEDGMTFTITGQPEVDVKVSVVVSEESKDVFLAAGTYADMTTGNPEDTFKVDETYYPVKFTLANGAGKVLKEGTIADIKSYFADISKVYDANKDLTTIAADVDGTYTLTWEWLFHVDAATDKMDTLLGDMAADASLRAKYVGDIFYPMAIGQEYCTDVNFGITITVEQVD